MYTLLLSSRAHTISDEMADRLITALEEARPVASIRVEMNGAGSGEWEVIVNVAQVVALIKHPTDSLPTGPVSTGLRLVPTTPVS